MRSCIVVLFILLLFVPNAESQIKISDDASINLNGVFTAWFQYQNDFWFGRADYQDWYAVQMLRFRPVFNYGENVKVITRFDMGQGWWGVNNEPPSNPVNAPGRHQRPGSGSGLFDRKDSHYFFHVDQAYLWFNVPGINTAFTVGRSQWLAGNRLVIDNQYDGIKADVSMSNGSMLSFGWAFVASGTDGISTLANVAPDWRGATDARNAYLYLANYATTLKNFGNTSLNLYTLFYKDHSTNDLFAYIPNRLDYKRARFSPQISQLFTVGVSGNSKFGSLSLEWEANYLTGKDDFNNPNYGPALDIDINDGTLRGYNAYVRAQYTVSDAVSIGGLAGLGSGDSDGPWGGKGNVNKLRTAGFWYLTEVWEDSIMPDEEGITPQGLGAPNVRGYRELENTTAGQVNVTLRPVPRFSMFFSYTLLRATEPIYAWGTEILGDGSFGPNHGPNRNLSAQDIGWEVDFKFDYRLVNRVLLTARGGYFNPGTATGYLINGSDQWTDPAWELKGEVTFAF